MLGCVNYMQPKCQSFGYSLVEMVVVVAVMGVLAAAAIPSFGEWIQDTKTRTVAETMQNGIRLAQSEAVKRGRQVEFFLTDAAPGLNAAASTTGRNWGIQTRALASASAEAYIQGAALKGDASHVLVTSSSARLVFNSIGRLADPLTPVTLQVTNPKGNRAMNVTVSTAGSVRMCDPAKSRANSPDGCE